MTSAYVTVSPVFPSALHPSRPQCLLSTLTFSSQAFQCPPQGQAQYPEKRGLLSDSLSSK